ncbi:MAG TPA: glycosyltransferase, partial [Thermoanaerobaculia bacterium]|nr:glycosyltransferase [Thermoanaerobaculia bacterium]
NEPEARRQLAAHGHRTILSRHTCAHRVDELMEIVAELRADPSPRQHHKQGKAQLV